MQSVVERSKSGLPTVSEYGGGSSNTGYCQLVCASSGQRIKPIYAPIRGHSNAVHAVFVAKVGMCLVSVSHDRSSETVTIKRISAIGNGDNLDDIVFVLVGEYENGDSNIPKEFQAVKMVALEKSRCYHCREAHYLALQG